MRVAHVTTVDLTLRHLLLGQMSRLRDEGFDVTGISAPGPWVDDLLEEGLNHIAWPHATRSWHPRADLLALKELIAILRSQRFDIVHLHNPKPGMIGRVAAKILGVPIIVNTVHGLYATPEDRFTKRFVVLSLEALCSRFSDLELYQSEEDLEWARARRVVSRGKSLLLGNGTDLRYFNANSVSDPEKQALRAELGIPNDHVVVGTVGRLVAEKGYRELIDAAAQVRNSSPDVTFLLVGGSDPEKADALTHTEIAQAQPDVLFAGWRSDVRDVMAVMDVFVLPSWREGVPRSAIEAAAMSLPLVVTNVRGCREVVRDEVEGLVVPVRNPQELTRAIRRLVESPELRRRMGTAARARAEARYDEERVMDTVVNCYTDLLDSKEVREQSDGIRKAVAGDAAQLARLHSESMPTAFLPALGNGFMRTLYRALIRAPEAVVLVMEQGGRVVGFCAGVPSVGRFYRRFLSRHGLTAAFRAAPRLLRPSVIKRVLETRGYPSQASNLPDAELLSIAVNSEARSRGVGSELARRWLKEMSKRGATEVKVVVGVDNYGANSFYERAGFVHVATLEVHSETSSNVWVIRCHSSSLSV